MSKKDNTEHQSPDDLVKFVENLKNQWMSTIDALVDPLMIVKEDYTVHKANKAMARLADTNVKNIVGKKCYSVFAGRTSPCTGCAMGKNQSPGTNETFELANVRDDRFYEVTTQTLHDADNRFNGSVQIYRDRTAAKRMQEQLMQQEKLASIGLLAGGVAHEINNPLGGILIFSQMLLREMDKASPHYQDVVEIEAATQRCKAIVESLLDFARQRPFNHGKEGEHSVNVVDTIKTALRFGKVSIQRTASVTIDSDLDEQEHFIAGDSNKLIQLFLNLIQNALQAMPDGGSLTIRNEVFYKDSKPFGRYTFEDTGIGISRENLKKIFDPFFTTKDPGEGTGLGLALCYGIVQELGGKMSCESQIGDGTRFTVELPLTNAAKNQESA